MCINEGLLKKCVCVSMEAIYIIANTSDNAVMTLLSSALLLVAFPASHPLLSSCSYFLLVFFLLFFPFSLRNKGHYQFSYFSLTLPMLSEQRTANRQKDKKSEIIDLMSVSIRERRGRGAAQREEGGERQKVSCWHHTGKTNREVERYKYRLVGRCLKSQK